MRRRAPLRIEALGLVRKAWRVTLAAALASSPGRGAPAFVQNPPPAQSQDIANDLPLPEPGRFPERDLSAGGKDTYRIAAPPGLITTIHIEPAAMDLVARLRNQDGTVAIEIRSEGRKGPLELTTGSSIHRLEIEPEYPRARAGKYRIRVDELRPATEKDRLLFEAASLSCESLRAYRLGAYTNAQVSEERALGIRERVLEPDDAEVAASLDALGLILDARNNYARAEALYRRALAITEKATGNAQLAVAQALNDLAKNSSARAEYAEAERLARQALDIRQNALGPDHFLVAVSLGALGDILLAKGDPADAETAADRALEIAGKAYGPDDLPYADFLSRSGRVQVDRANYARAGELCARAVDLAERAAGPDSLPAADALQGLASLALFKGDNVRSEELHRRVLEIKEKILGGDHLDVGLILHNLGLLHYRRRDYVTAEAFCARSLAIKEKILGPTHPLVAHTVNNLGLIHWRLGNLSRATEFFRRTLEICEKAYGAESSRVAQALANLGIMSKETGDYERAEAFYSRALAIMEKLNGPRSRAVVVSAESLGILYRDKGDYDRAEPLLLRTLAITEESVGPDHPDVARHLQNLAQLYAARGDVANALRSFQRLSAVEERNLPLNLAAGSERQKLAYFDPFAHTFEKIISFQVRQSGGDGNARDLAATTLLQRKGRVLDAMADSLGALRGRSNAEDRALLDHLSAVTSQLATLVLNGPQKAPLAEHRERIRTLTEQRENLENEVNRRSAGFYERSNAVTLAAIQGAVPADSALIEFGVYRPFDFKAAGESTKGWEDPRYVVYVIPGRGEIRWKDLGRAAEIDGAVEAFRRTLRDPGRTDAGHAGRALDEKVMRPVRALAGDATHLLLSPDGQLDLIPFEALVDEGGRHLVERYSVTYLSAGRDLLRLQVAPGSNREPLVVADPSFGEPRVAHVADAKPSSSKRKTADPRRSVTTGAELSSVYFAPLAGTAEEARTIRSLFPDARILSGARATKAALKSAEAPRILHIATHGFFLQNSAGNGTAGTAAPRVGDTRSINTTSRIENPLLRSGLALTGANLSNGGNDDGILTALEAANLNLWGTRLVTLSACDTGIGEVKNGDGVYGLRRAFFLAGAETLVMSLWPVSDRVTREMMTAYYSGLRKGLGRGAALRKAQLAMMKRKGREHPFYWASFIQSGEWANLDGLRRSARSVPPPSVTSGDFARRERKP